MKKKPPTSNPQHPTSNVSRPTLVSGIQPSGRLHLGNYLGALKNFVDLQNSDKYDCYFFIADLHSLTESASGRINPKEKSKQILGLTADFIAAGLDPQKSVIFQQSQIPAHSELAFILNTITPMGELSRMTQFKEKSEAEKENSNTGLFTYPTLMAADILLYNAKFVPVGNDQDQHLELARTLARKFNARFGKTFTEPQGLHAQTPRVMSLGNPEKKMSKSLPETCLFMDDSPEIIKSKIKRAVTDSESVIKYSPETKPAISNLLTIYSAISGETIPEIEKEFKNKTYSEFKSSLAEAVIKHLAPIQKKKRLTSNVQLRTILNRGSEVAAKIANKKISEVKSKIGISI
ncbi:MAG: tryptophan--tRNA ligase [Patescibacteria group bacterium]